jgi:hypothetical protein
MYNYSKRGQITAFIIIGMLLLFVAGIYFGLNKLVATQVETELKVAQDFATAAEQVNTYMKECVKDAGISGIRLFGYIGSTLDSPAGSFRTTDIPMPIAYLRNGANNHLPTIPEWEATLSDIIKMELEDCDFKAFEDQGYILQKGNATITTTIGEDKVNFDAEYPIKIMRDTNTKEFSKYNTIVPYRIGYLHKFLDFLIKEEIRDPGFIPASKILKFNLNVTTFEYQAEDTLIYSIEDRFGGEYYRFLFADKEQR